MNTQKIIGLGKGLAAACAFLALGGCGDYFDLLSGQQACSKWVDEQKPDNALHDAANKWATSFFPAFQNKFCEKNQCTTKLQFPQDNERLVKSMTGYCAANPNAKIMMAAANTMVVALRKPQ